MEERCNTPDQRLLVIGGKKGVFHVQTISREGERFTMFSKRQNSNKNHM